MALRVTPLKDGKWIPTIGYGCYEVTGAEAKETFLAAARCGYTHFDSASFYKNEAEVGLALKQFMKENPTYERNSLYYTTKAWTNEQGAQLGKNIDKAVERCGLGYIDLMLLHWPASDKATRQESWKALAKAVKDGKIKSAGVSNYNKEQIQEIFDLETGVFPVVNQIEISPWKQDRALIEFCEKEGIVLQAYCPLARGKSMEDPKLVRLADRYQKTPAQILIKWSLQRGFVPLPKSSNSERMAQNINVEDFSLDPEDMDTLNAFA